jgi:hypothetical protein
MQVVTGIFMGKAKAEQALEKVRASGLAADKVTLLSPGRAAQENLKSVPVTAAEQPGMGAAVGAVVGGAAGLSTAMFAALVPGVGWVTAAGILGAAALTAAGASVGAAAGKTLENFTTEGLPEDENFVYEDALRRGRHVVVAVADDDAAASSIRQLLKNQGADAVDAAREQ